MCCLKKIVYGDCKGNTLLNVFVKPTMTNQFAKVFFHVQNFQNKTKQNKTKTKAKQTKWNSFWALDVNFSNIKGDFKVFKYSGAGSYSN